MKITDLYEEDDFLTDKDKILEWMKNSSIMFEPNNLTIESDGLTYSGFLIFKNQAKLKKLKVKFKSVHDFNCSNTSITSLIGAPIETTLNFNCRNTEITSLEGCPRIVGHNFYCSNTKITSLEGSPQKVGGDFDCGKNKIYNLQGCTQEIGQDFHCWDTDIKNLIGGPQIVHGDLQISSNKNLSSLEGIPKIINGDANIIDANITNPKDYRWALYSEIKGNFISNNSLIDEIINTYGGAANKKYWPHAINLLGKV